MFEQASCNYNIFYHFVCMLKGLVEQLSLLRSINTRLTDENDLRDYGSGSIDNSDEPASIFKEMEEASAAVSVSENNFFLYSNMINEEIEDTDSVDIVFDLDLDKESDITVNICLFNNVGVIIKLIIQTSLSEFS